MLQMLLLQLLLLLLLLVVLVQLLLELRVFWQHAIDDELRSHRRGARPPTRPDIVLSRLSLKGLTVLRTSFFTSHAHRI